MRSWQWEMTPFSLRNPVLGLSPHLTPQGELLGAIGTGALLYLGVGLENFELPPFCIWQNVLEALKR